jgi:hypothetical protein
MAAIRADGFSRPALCGSRRGDSNPNLPITSLLSTIRERSLRYEFRRLTCGNADTPSGDVRVNPPTFSPACDISVTQTAITRA